MEKLIKGKNVPVNVAAKIMGKSPMFIRIGLQKGILPIGIAFKTNDCHEKYDYYISPQLLMEYTGAKIEADDPIIKMKSMLSINDGGDFYEGK